MDRLIAVVTFLIAFVRTLFVAALTGGTWKPEVPTAAKN